MTTSTSSLTTRERRTLSRAFGGGIPRPRHPADGTYRRRTRAREDWSVDPWTLLERDGWFYGRGTSDNKAGAAMLDGNFSLEARGGSPSAI